MMLTKAEIGKNWNNYPEFYDEIPWYMNMGYLNTRIRGSHQVPSLSALATRVLTKSAHSEFQQHPLFTDQRHLIGQCYYCRDLFVTEPDVLHLCRYYISYIKNRLGYRWLSLTQDKIRQVLWERKGNVGETIDRLEGDAVYHLLKI